MKQYYIRSVFRTPQIILFIVLLVTILSCDQKNNSKNLVLDPRYQQIEKISTLANCRGPQGYYTTEVNSSTGGDCFFSQAYADSDQLFHAKVTPDNEGFVLDNNQNIIDTLPIEAVVMIKSHDFHRLNSSPEQFFHHIEFDKKIEKGMELYRALDQLENKVKLFYNREKEQITKIELLNPMDTTQTIEVINKQWIDSAYGKMVKELEIVQAHKDTFYFNFEKIEINI